MAMVQSFDSNRRAVTICHRMGSTMLRVSVSETSDRLQLLEPFSAWDGSDISGGAIVLTKTRHSSMSPSPLWTHY